ncbi:unnamed protein product [Phytophthora fragariaefolia]|uniref:Unnamed protein product n=1 Tax=Phytophthora fragariaefolia TaxID=1490495 RepID=A0A9W6X266_9STRA|nr:unnamed protein product [Phytophthora fragariaefolia]
MVAAITSTDFEPGAVVDVTMFRDNGAFHRSAMRKLPDEAALSDDGSLSAANGNDWTVLMAKGYQGLADEYRAIHPKKKAHEAPPVTLDELQNNDKIAHDRVIVEHFFGRLKTLWGICSHKWEWVDMSYNMIFRACVALTNYSVRCCPLRREDGECFLRYETRLIQIGLEIEADKKRKRQESRDGRRARLKLTARCGTRRRLSLGTTQNASPCEQVRCSTA